MIALWVGVMSTERVLAIMCMAVEMWELTPPLRDHR